VAPKGTRGALDGRWGLPDWRVLPLVAKFWLAADANVRRDARWPFPSDRFPYLQIFLENVVGAASETYGTNRCNSPEEWATLVLASSAIAIAMRRRGLNAKEPMAHFLFHIGRTIRSQLYEGATVNLDELDAFLDYKHGVSLAELLEEPAVLGECAPRRAAAAAAGVVAAAAALSPASPPPAPIPSSPETRPPARPPAPLELDRQRRELLHSVYQNLDQDRRAQIDARAEQLAREELGERATPTRLALRQVDRRHEQVALLVATEPSVVLGVVGGAASA
jgi:hypothetical protein